jgi:hypothetical protein
MQSVAQNALLYADIQAAIKENELALKRYVEDNSVSQQTNFMQKELLRRLLKKKITCIYITQHNSSQYTRTTAGYLCVAMQCNQSHFLKVGSL